jgi:hypothetical protein
MLLNVLDNIGDRNPQVFRELKGRLNLRNILITGAASGLIQFIVFQGFNSELPVDFEQDIFRKEAYSRFCKGPGEACVRLADGSFDINWQWWWLHIFTWLSVIMLFILLVGGTYLLINDLAREEKRGTLNFLRLTPQPTHSLLLGKLLGVPILLYLFVAFTIPLHLRAAIGAELSARRILLFYALMIASSIFFFSAAILFAFAASWLNGFQAWLGSGILLGFFLISMAWLQNGYQIENVTAWLRLLSPLEVSSYIFPFSTVYGYSSPSTLQNLQFLQWQADNNSWLVICLTFGNYALWTYWVWQGLNRCFRNPNTTLFSKKQSYGFVACCQVLCFGFAVPLLAHDRYIFGNLLAFNFLLFMSLIAILSPHRTALYDWARYRYQQSNLGKAFWKSFLDKKLLFDDKSPAVVAIAVNLAISAIPVIALLCLKLIVEAKDVPEDVTKFILGMALFASIMMIFTTVAQRMLLLANPKRSLWATLTIASLIILPPIMLALLRMGDTYNHPNVWLFTSIPWVGIEQASTTAMFMALLSELAVVVLLNANLGRQLRLAGESETKALLSQ